MKLFNKFVILAGLAALGVACDPAAENFEPGPESAGAYFATTLPASYSITAADSSVSVVLTRSEASEALSVSLSGSGDPIFTFPASATFAAGAKEAIVEVGVDVDNIEIDRAYSLSLAVTDNAYYYGKSDYTFSVILPAVYEPIGTGYWVDNTILYWFGVDPDIAMYVDIECAVLPGVTKYRFKNPFLEEAQYMDELGGFDYYPYNEDGDFVSGGDEVFVVSVMDDGSATLDPVALGMDWGYGMFTIGTIYGNLSTSPSYPLGVYDAAAGMISFGPNSLFCDMADYGTGVCDGTSYLFLSKEAYAAWLAQ